MPPTSTAAAPQTVAPGITLQREPRIAIVRYDAGDKANALSAAVMQALLDLALQLQREPDLSAVVLTGAADKFSLGFDLREAGRFAGMSLSERREALAIGPRLCAAWQELEAMTIAAIEGWCVGGGVALAAAFDIRVAGAGARFYIPEIERGMNMSWGSVPRLVNLVGAARTKQLVLLAQKIDLQQACDWGLVQDATPTGGALEQALTLARSAAAMPPVQLRMCKTGIDAYANALARATSVMDRDQFLLALASEDFAEGVQAFLQKRAAQYRG